MTPSRRKLRWTLTLVLIAFIFVIINLIVDILYVVIDPRVRLKADPSS